MTGSDMDSKLQKYSLKEREEIKKAYCGPKGEPGIVYPCDEERVDDIETADRRSDL